MDHHSFHQDMTPTSALVAQCALHEPCVCDLCSLQAFDQLCVYIFSVPVTYSQAVIRTFLASLQEEAVLFGSLLTNVPCIAVFFIYLFFCLRGREHSVFSKVFPLHFLFPERPPEKSLR